MDHLGNLSNLGVPNPMFLSIPEHPPSRGVKYPPNSVKGFEKKMFCLCADSVVVGERKKYY